MSLTSLEGRASELVNGETCPTPHAPRQVTLGKVQPLSFLTLLGKSRPLAGLGVLAGVDGLASRGPWSH